MKTMIATVVAVLALALPALAQEKLTVEDVGKLAQAGVSDDVIIARIEQQKTTFELTAAQVAFLKQQKVSDRVLAALVGKSAPAPAVPVQGAGNLAVKNSSHRALKVSVNERDRIVSFSRTEGTEAAQGGELAFQVAAGEYRIAIEGSPTRHTVTLPATLLVRGAETSYIDVTTLTIQDKAGSTVMILNSEGRTPPGQRRPPAVTYDRIRYGGPQFSYVPAFSPAVLLGAGIGAVIGHQSGHKWEGAAIGAGAGLLFDWLLWR